MKMLNKPITLTIICFCLLVIFTSFVKNKARNLEKDISKLKKNISSLNKHLSDAEIDFTYLSNPGRVKKYLTDKSMNVYSVNSGAFKISDAKIQELSAIYGKYNLLNTTHDSDSNRIRWLLSRDDGGMLYYLKNFINKEKKRTDSEIKDIETEKQKLEGLLVKMMNDKGKKEQKSECNSFQIVKYYDNKSDLTKDNVKSYVYYDEHLDNTPRFILKQLYPDLKPGIELYNEIIKTGNQDIIDKILEKLRTLDGYETATSQDEVIMNILIGGKIVKINDKCL